MPGEEVIGRHTRPRVMEVLMVMMMVMAANFLQAISSSSELFPQVGVEPFLGARCWVPGELLATTATAASSTLFLWCARQCGRAEDCRFFSLAPGECRRYTGVMSAECSVAGVGEGEAKVFMKFQSNLALLRPVLASSTVYDHRVTFDDMARYPFDWTSFLDCPCTQTLPNQWASVDLGATCDVSLIRVTLSLEARETMFKTVTVFVGDSGDPTKDPVVARSLPATRTPKQVITYEVAARGRFVTIQQLELLHLCFCNLEVY
ncbi:uncharacterized protein LOC127000846 [Eriocheir sinensis]|uniref:uncharacterized protein LOC127000846 n=1 Tax=Eriocheir sinensis TaxID=95602 RepID=UPI0021C6F3D2|nr:uncharacterized protein LOC127000846 [Eriocheir sinensis]